MTRPILVPLDGSALAEQALPFAEALAEASGSPLLLLCASYVASVPGLDVADEQVRLVTDAELYLSRVATRLKRRGFAVETCAPYGLPRQVIAREARVRRAWLIAMATHGRGGLGRALYGSVADGVVRQTPVPVLLVRAWHAGDSKARLLGAGPLLVPLDGSAYADEALPTARSLATMLRTSVILARAIPPPDTALTPDGMAVALFGEDGAVAEREAREHLEQAAATFVERGIAVETIVRHGEPTAIIAAVAEERGAALTVLAVSAAPRSSATAC
jgi:nucleotide-binding universal stress UspA family protein